MGVMVQNKVAHFYGPWCIDITAANKHDTTTNTVTQRRQIFLRKPQAAFSSANKATRYKANARFSKAMARLSIISKFTPDVIIDM